MELIYLPGSSWTVSLLWGLSYSGNVDKISHWTAHTPLFGELRLRWKAGTLFPSKPLTVPMLINEQGRMVNCSALESAKLLCSESLFPEGKAEEIAEWYLKADEVCRYGRSVSFSVGENLLEKMAPEVPLFIGRMVAKWMRRKYEEGELEAQLAMAQKNLREVAGIVDKEELVFLLGTSTPTFADFAWAVTLESMTPEFDIILTKFLPKTNKKVQDLLAGSGSFETEYAPLLKWKRRVIQKYFVENAEVQEIKKRLLTLPGPKEEAAGNVQTPDEGQS